MMVWGKDGSLGGFQVFRCPHKFGDLFLSKYLLYGYYICHDYSVTGSGWVQKKS